MDQLRLSHYRDLYAILNDYRATTILEALAFDKSCSYGLIHGMPSWAYSNGTTLFETDKPEAHMREQISSYVESMIETTALAEANKDKAIADPYSTLLHGPSAFTAWRDKYYLDIVQSKLVLEEEVEDSKFITCKCGSNKVNTEQKQTRSADEPMTIFCNCIACGKRFTIS